MENLINYLKINKNYRIKSLYKKFYNDAIERVLNKYNLTFAELVYRIIHNIDFSKIFTCKYCGSKVLFHRYNGYHEFCNNKCSLTYRNKSQEHKDKSKQTLLKKYGVDNYTKTKEYKDKYKQTCLEKYGVESHNKLDSCKEKARKTCKERYGNAWYASTQECKDNYKQICLKKYGVENYSLSNERKGKESIIQEKRMKTIFNKYCGKYYMSTPECQNKRNMTMKRNGSFITSAFEEDVYRLLLTKFNNSDIERQYKSKLYPFACDFYIKSLDLYIECNGIWTHGKDTHGKIYGSFDKDNLEHQQVLKKWKELAKNSKFYRNAIYVWTILDPLKLETFKKNKLNYKIFWNLEEVEDWIRGF